MKVSERLNVNPGLLATYAGELLRAAMPEGYTLGVWSGNPGSIFDLKIRKPSEGRPPENPNPDKVTLTFGRQMLDSWGFADDSVGILVALRSSGGCWVSGDVADDLSVVWAAFLAQVRELVARRPTKPDDKPAEPVAGSGAEVWFAWRAACAAAGYRVGLKFIADKVGLSYGYIKTKHAEWKSEHVEDVT